MLLLAAGTVLVLGVTAGLYVLVGPVIVALVGGVTSAWLLLTKITEERGGPAASSAVTQETGRDARDDGPPMPGQ